MDKILPDITDEMRQHLQRQGLKPYEPRPIADFLNPHKPDCIF